METRDEAFRARHLIPDLPSYGFDAFDEFAKARASLIENKLRGL
jgi:hypothetical protein